MTMGELMNGNGQSYLPQTGQTLAASSASAQIEAYIKLRGALAERNQRDWDDVRARILKEVKRPTFAAMCQYRIKRGSSTIIGPSIRFAEAVVRNIKNLTVLEMLVSDDAERRVVRVLVMDLESNIDYGTDITLEKTVERSNPSDRNVVGQRVNSNGQVVYIVKATEDELQQKKAAASSKIMRNAILRILPADILEDAMAMVRSTLASDHAKDPAAMAKRIMDAFASVGVEPSQVKAYLGKQTLDVLSEEEVSDLRTILQGIKDGELSWAEVYDAKLGEREKALEDGSGSLAEKVSRKAASAAKKSAEPAQ